MSWIAKLFVQLQLTADDAATSISTLLATLEDGVVVRDATGKIVSFNPTALRLLDAEEKDLLGRTSLDIHGPIVDQDENPIELEFQPGQEPLRSGEPRDNQIVGVLTRTKQRHWISVHSLPVLDPDTQKVVCVFSTLHDQTEKMSAILERKATARLRQALLDSTPSAILIANRDGVITTLNTAAEQLLLVLATDVVGKVPFLNFCDFFEIVQHCEKWSEESGAKLAPGFASLVAPVLEHGYTTAKWTLIRSDHTSIPVVLSVSGYYDEKQALQGFLIFARDVSEENYLRNQIDQQQARLIRSAQMLSLSEMASGVAHEINNPLGVIYGKLSILEKNLPTLEESEQAVLFQFELAKIRENAERIARIVKAMRSFSRSDEAELERFEISTTLLIEQTLELCQGRIRKRGIRLDVEESATAIVESQGSKLSQALMSLVQNSVDAVAHTPNAWIRIATRKIDESRIEIQVTDSGTGLPQEVADRLMQPFFTTKDVGQGMGLGLSVAKGVLEDHGGRLRYNVSSPNTSFSIELPIRQTKIIAA